MQEDMTPHVSANLADAERDQVNSHLPSGRSAVIRNEPDVIHAFQAVKKHYADWIDPSYGPKLIRDWEKTWDSPQPTIPWAIVWPEGPDDWAITFSQADAVDRTRVFVEAGNGHVLSLYRP